MSKSLSVGEFVDTFYLWILSLTFTGKSRAEAVVTAAAQRAAGGRGGAPYVGERRVGDGMIYIIGWRRVEQGMDRSSSMKMTPK
jgi:hypothetical protein